LSEPREVRPRHRAADVGVRLSANIFSHFNALVFGKYRSMYRLRYRFLSLPQRRPWGGFPGWPLS
jgi:hypothetical protein